MNAVANVHLKAIERSTDLHALTEIVHKGRATTIEVVTALRRIRDAKLYRLTHRSWETWCDEHWWCSKRHADRQIAALDVVEDLGPGVPLGGQLARSLASMPAEERKLVIVQAQELAGDEPATASDIREVVERRTHPMPGQLGLGLPGQPSRELSQWDTRPGTAAQLVAWAGARGADLGPWRPGRRVLEPSAGKGHIVKALREAGAEVTAVELDQERAALTGAVCDDFLAYAAKLGPGDHFDLAVMNPPYENGQDLAHIVAALSLCPVVVVLARLVLLEGQDRRAQLWDQHSLRRLRVFSARESFEGAVDGSPKSAMAMFEITRGHGRSIVEWC